jgi:hypothetical protein
MTEGVLGVEVAAAQEGRAAKTKNLKGHPGYRLLAQYDVGG